MDAEVGSLLIDLYLVEVSAVDKIKIIMISTLIFFNKILSEPVRRINSYVYKKYQKEQLQA